MNLVVNFIIGFLNILMVVGSLLLIGIILIQRGKGGGLAGAFGGVGGSSAFGTKAGDVFTKITIGLAAGWIVAAMILVVLTNTRRRSAFDTDSPAAVTKEVAPGSGKSKTKTASDLGPGDAPPPIQTPATGAPISTPRVEMPPLPDIPAIVPEPAKSAPAATSGKAAPAPATTPPPAPSTPATSPAKPASTPK
jgi:preprotein translocase subunit SecG